MLKRYDIEKDEMIEITQDWLDAQIKYSTALAVHYKNHSPENFKKFMMNIFLLAR